MKRGFYERVNVGIIRGGIFFDYDSDGDLYFLILVADDLVITLYRDDSAGGEIRLDPVERSAGAGSYGGCNAWWA